MKMKTKTITYILVFISILFSTEMIHASIIIKNINDENSELISNCIQGTFIDSQQNLWVGMWGGLVQKYDIANDDWKDYSHTFDANMRSPEGYNVAPVRRIYEDKNGTIIYHSYSGGFGFYQDNDWYFKSVPNDNQTNYMTDMCMAEKAIYAVDNSCSTDKGYVRSLTLNYNIDLQQYEILEDYNFLKTAPEEILLPNRNFHCIIENDGYIYCFADSAILRYGITDKSWFSFTDKNNKSKISIQDLLVHYQDLGSTEIWVNYYEVLYSEVSNCFYLFGYHINEKNDEQYIENFIVKIAISEDNIESLEVIDIPTSKNSVNLNEVEFVNSEKDSIFIGGDMDLFVLDLGSDKLSFIPSPEEFGDNNDWNITSLAANQEAEELWVGTFSNGIYVCDKNKLISLAVPVGVEIEPFIPMLDIYKTYPLPSQSYTNVEFFQQSGTLKELDVSIYDIKGNKIEKAEYNVEPVSGQRKRIKITTSNLQSGIYLCQIKYKEYSTTAKFIVE